MNGFQVDTSGAVRLRWPHHSLLAQGYISALLESVGQRRYDRIEPQTVARIIEDCTRLRSIDRGIYSQDNHLAGRAFWAMRQSQHGLPDFPPLTVSVGDDGMVTAL